MIRAKEKRVHKHRQKIIDLVLQPGQFFQCAPSPGARIVPAAPIFNDTERSATLRVYAGPHGYTIKMNFRKGGH